jgi:hypothetical protein
MNGWKGVFELSNSGNNGHKPNSLELNSKYSDDEIKQIEERQKQEGVING